MRATSKLSRRLWGWDLKQREHVGESRCLLTSPTRFLAVFASGILGVQTATKGHNSCRLSNVEDPQSKIMHTLTRGIGCSDFARRPRGDSAVLRVFDCHDNAHVGQDGG